MVFRSFLSFIFFNVSSLLLLCYLSLSCLVPLSCSPSRFFFPFTLASLPHPTSHHPCCPHLTSTIAEALPYTSPTLHFTHQFSLSALSYGCPPLMGGWAFVLLTLKSHTWWVSFFKTKSWSHFISVIIEIDGYLDFFLGSCKGGGWMEK